MRFHEFDLNLLVYLDALLTETSVSRAAERVFITQPAMSTALSRLREYYKDELLVRVTSRKMRLTPLAESLVGPVRSTLEQAQLVANASMDFDPATSKRKFIIMALDYVTDVFMRRVIVRLRQVAPGMQVDIRRMTFETRVHLRRGDVDLLIVPERLILDGLPLEKLWEEPSVCIVWSENRLVGKDISFKQYLELGHVATITHGYVDHCVAQLGGVRRVEVTVPEMSMIPRLIEGTDRIATVLQGLAELYARECSLRLIPPPLALPSVIEVMQWRPDQEPDPVFRWFRQFIKSVANEMSAGDKSLTPARRSPQKSRN